MYLGHSSGRAEGGGDHLGLRKRSSNALRFGCWFVMLFSEESQMHNFGFRFGGKMNEDYGNYRLNPKS